MLSQKPYDSFLNSTTNHLIYSGDGLLRSADCRELTYALPEDFVFHFLRRDYHQYESRLKKKFLKHLPDSVDTSRIISETARIVRDFARCTKVNQLLVSLRVVTPQYLARESPSVSQYYHRDSTAVTITKVYFGEGAVYVDDDNVRRAYFAAHSIQAPDVSDAEILYDPSKTHMVEDGAVLLLKGEVYPDIDARSREVIDLFLSPDKIPDFNRGNGFIHKGGGFGMGDRRLVFTASVYV